MGSDPPSLLLSGGGDRPHHAAGPELLQRERESRMSEGVGTGWLGESRMEAGEARSQER